MSVVAIVGPLMGAEALLRTFMGRPYQTTEDGALEAVDSIDLIIVGLGLVLILLVLLRR
jgi:hypothetical protein